MGRFSNLEFGEQFEGELREKSHFQQGKQRPVAKDEAFFLAEAKVGFEKALALAPRDWFVRWLAGRIHYYYQKFATALNLVQEALSLNAGRGVLWLQFGLCQQAMGLIGPARVSFQQARELCPDRSEAD